MSETAKTALTAGASLITGLVAGVLLDPLKACFKRRRVKSILYSELAAVYSTLHMCEIEGSMSIEIESFADQSRDAFLMRLGHLHTRRFQHIFATDKDSFYGIDGSDEIETFLSQVTTFITERESILYAAQVSEVCRLAALFRHYQDLGHINRKTIERQQEKHQKAGLKAIDNLACSFAEHGKDSSKLKRFKKKHPHLFKTEASR